MVQPVPQTRPSVGYTSALTIAAIAIADTRRGQAHSDTVDGIPMVFLPTNPHNTDLAVRLFLTRCYCMQSLGCAWTRRGGTTWQVSKIDGNIDAITNFIV